MNCTFSTHGEQRDGRQQWQCGRCGYVTVPLPPTSRISRECDRSPFGETPPCDVPTGDIPGGRIRIDTSRLPFLHVFNCSLLINSRRWLVFRVGHNPSRICVIELGHDWQPIGDYIPLDFPAVPQNSGSAGMHEDPRVIGDGWLAYWGFDSSITCHPMLAQVDEQWNVVRHFSPVYPDRRHGEKNWAWFWHDGALHCVYSVSPEHRVLRLDGETLREVASHRWEPGWRFGEMRGGASPVLHNGEWYHFFHGTGNRNLLYTGGLYTFSVDTFQPRRWIPNPLLIPNKAEQPEGVKKLIVFPCGAVLENGQWVVSYGSFDKWSEVATFGVEEVESALEEIC